MPSAITSPTPWRFQGRILESADGSSDLYDFQARSYDPSLGAFTSLDSVSGSAQNPLTLNRFLYAAANPATLVDPDGHTARTYIYDADDQHRQSAASIAAARAAGKKYRDKLAADAEYEFMHRRPKLPPTTTGGALDKNSEAARRAKISKLEGYDVFDPFGALNHLESECRNRADRAACDGREAARAAIGPLQLPSVTDFLGDAASTLGDIFGYWAGQIEKNTKEALDHINDFNKDIPGFEPIRNPEGVANSAAGGARLRGQVFKVAGAVLDIFDVGREVEEHGWRAGVRKAGIIGLSSLAGVATAAACTGGSLGWGAPLCAVAGGLVGGSVDFVLEQLIPRVDDPTGKVGNVVGDVFGR
jgi:RHS repeat-associated protein